MPDGLNDDAPCRCVYPDKCFCEKEDDVSISKPSSQHEILVRAYVALATMDEPPIYQVWTLAEKALNLAGVNEAEVERLQAIYQVAESERAKLLLAAHRARLFLQDFHSDIQRDVIVELDEALGREHD